MNKKTFWAALLVGVGIIIGGCGQKQESAMPAVYGVADYETLIKSHPKYSEYFRLETEYNHLIQQYSNERNQMMKVYSMKTQVDNALQDKNALESAQKELQSRIKAKENELNEKLKKTYENISAKHNKNVLIDKNNFDDNIRIANLQMKFVVTGISQEEKEKAEKELQELLKNRSISNEDFSDWTEEEKTFFIKEKEKAADELEAFAKSSAEKIKSEIGKKSIQKFDSEEKVYPELKSWDENWQHKLELKQKQMAKIKSEIMEDIRKDAERVALEKNLSMIFSEHTINVSAVDVTGDIVSKIIQEE